MATSNKVQRREAGPASRVDPPVPYPGFELVDLLAEVGRLLQRARGYCDTLGRGKVDWGNLYVSDVQYRKSIMREMPLNYFCVLIHGASPESWLAEFLRKRIDTERFYGVDFECRL